MRNMCLYQQIKQLITSLLSASVTIWRSLDFEKQLSELVDFEKQL